MKIWTCGPHIYAMDEEGNMRKAQPNIPRANENVLTNEDKEKIMSSVCPIDKAKLEIRYL